MVVVSSILVFVFYHRFFCSPSFQSLFLLLTLWRKCMRKIIHKYNVYMLKLLPENLQAQHQTIYQF